MRSSKTLAGSSPGFCGTCAGRPLQNQTIPESNTLLDALGETDETGFGGFVTMLLGIFAKLFCTDSKII
jgi:hypothetical protein